MAASLAMVRSAASEELMSGALPLGLEERCFFGMLVAKSEVRPGGGAMVRS